MNSIRTTLLLAATFSATSLISFAEETRTETVRFEKGYDSAVVTGKISGYDSVIYELGAKDGQFLSVSLRPDNQSTEYNIYIPGRGPGDEALFISATGGREYTGQLYKDGVHKISVFLNRNAARKGDTANFDIAFRITDDQPAGPIPAETGPAKMEAPAGAPATGAPVAVDAPARSPWDKVTQAVSDHAPLLEKQAAIPEGVAKTPVSIAVLVLEKGLLGQISEVTTEYDTMERPGEVIVTVIESGILDDDLHGIRHKITLLRNSNDNWLVNAYTRGELRRQHFQ